MSFVINLQIKKYLVLFLSLTLFFFLSSIPVSGKEGDITLKEEFINPGSVYYPIKRIWEKFLLIVSFPAKNKTNYEISLLETRLSELNNVVKNKELSELQQSSQRFSYHAGILVDHIISNNQDKQIIESKFKSYIELLDQLRDKYPANSSFWLLIQQDIDSLNILMNKL